MCSLNVSQGEDLLLSKSVSVAVDNPWHLWQGTDGLDLETHRLHCGVCGVHRRGNREKRAITDWGTVP